jgi:hypothetical protein
VKPKRVETARAKEGRVAVAGRNQLTEEKTGDEPGNRKSING